MLTMVIADDEYLVRDGLVNVINWEEYDITIVGQAVNGQEALKLCLELSPDILLTDIRMPIMDGLEVAAILKEEKSNTKIIIISGIEDFNYAKTALEVKAEGYILKPVDIDELSKIVCKVKNAIILEKIMKTKMQELQAHMKVNSTLAHEKFLHSIIKGSYDSNCDIDEKIKYFQLPFEEEALFMIAVMKIDVIKSESEFSSEKEFHLLEFCIKNIANEILSTQQLGMCLCIGEGEFVMIFKELMIQNENYKGLCEDIITAILKLLQVHCSMGLGKPVKRFEQLSKSYKQAHIALDHRFYTGKNSIINFVDVEINNTFETSNEQLMNQNLYDIENLIIKAVKMGNIDMVTHNLNLIFKCLTQGKKHQVEFIQMRYAELISLVSRSIFENDESMEEIVGKSSAIIENIFQMSDIFEVNQYITELFVNLTGYYEKKYVQSKEKTIQLIKTIIHSRYREEISVALIAQEIYLTPNYISLLYKKYTGQTITEYLTQIRMEQAKTLLASTDLKILDVAEHVGYKNTNYFSTVFKKYTNVYPQKYRSDFAPTAEDR